LACAGGEKGRDTVVDTIIKVGRSSRMQDDYRHRNQSLVVYENARREGVDVRILITNVKKGHK